MVCRRHTSKWITDENQEGSYDYEYKEIKDGEEKSTVNKAGNYTKPTMRKRLFNKIMAGTKVAKVDNGVPEKPRC